MYHRRCLSSFSKDQGRGTRQGKRGREEGRRDGIKSWIQVGSHGRPSPISDTCSSELANAPQPQVDTARSKLSGADAKADQYRQDGTNKLEQVRKDTGKELNSAIDKFDKTVEKKTSEAKSGISSWFGGGK